MKVYIKKSNSRNQKEFIIPQNKSFNCNNWVHIYVDNAKEKFTVQKISFLTMIEDQWEVKENYTFPSSLLNEFLRQDHA